MLFLALGKGLAESKTVQPILNVTPPPERDNLDSLNPPILPGLTVARGVNTISKRKRVTPPLERDNLDSFSFDRDPKKKPKDLDVFHSLQSKPDPVITPTVEKRKFFRGLFKLF
jgi:hypothetical protein